MASISRLEVYTAMIKEGLIPIFYNSDVSIAKNVLRACQKGGVRFLEFTNRGDFALDVFKELVLMCKTEAKDMILGVGTIYDEFTAAQYVSYGANFVVSPFLNENISRFCNKRKIAYIPGCATTTEISRAEEYGAEIIKLYPASSIGGPDYIKTIMGPMPWTRIMPTGGILANYDDLAAWFRAGIVAVGIGNDLLKPALLKAGDYEGVSSNVSQVYQWIQEIKKIG